MTAQGRAELLTVGVIARELKLPIYRVEYIIRSRSIQHSSWAGNAKVYDAEVLERVRREMKRIESGREQER